MRSKASNVTIFSLSSFFFGCAKKVGICEATKGSSGASSKKREKKAAFVGCIWRSLQIGHCDVIGLQMRPPKDADPELRRSNCGKPLILTSYSAFTYSIVGTQRVEGVGPTHKQAALSAEQHLHKVTAFILQGEERDEESESLVCRRGEESGKKIK